MLRRSQCFHFIVAAVCLSASVALALDPVLLTSNPSFENQAGASLDGWSYREGLQPQLQTHDLGGNTPTELDQFAGNHFVSLTGTGGFGQFATIADDTKELLFNVMGYHNQNSGSFLAQVTLYDAFWNELRVVQVWVGPRSNANATGLNAHTYGIAVPPGTTFALMAVFNYDNDRVLNVDRLALLDATARVPNAETPNLVVNPQLPTRVRSDYFVQGTEFWFADRSLSDYPFGVQGVWGSMDRSQFGYQLVDMRADRTYIVDASQIVGIFMGIPAQAGFDFYDEDWNFIEKRVVQVGSYRNDSVIVTPPPGTANTTVYVYVPQGTYSVHPTIRVFDAGPNDSSTTAVIEDLSLSAGPRFSNTSGWSMTLWLKDSDGLDLSSIQSGDFFYTSRSDPNLEYPVAFLDISSSNPQAVGADGNRVASVIMASFLPDPSDFGRLVLRAGAISDVNGNTNQRIEFAEFPSTDQ